jgi:hypothetical protein
VRVCIFAVSIWIFSFILMNHYICFLIFKIMTYYILIKRFICHVIIINLMKFQKRIFIPILWIFTFLIKSMLCFLILINSY